MNSDYYLLIGALNTFCDFTGEDNKDFVYDYNAPGFSELLSKYPIREAAGNGTQLEKVLNLLSWCSRNVLHNGGIKDVEFVPKTSLGILDYAYQKGRENGVYCRLQAIVFSECCLAMGIKSRILHCLPFSPYDFDTHVVSIVYIDSLKKWILLDPGNNQYFMDENNVILSPLEVRKRLGDDEYVKSNIDDENYKHYMAKNLFYFKSLQNNTFGSDLQYEQEIIYCAPKGFNVLKREIAYSKYAIENSPPNLAADWEKALEKFTKRTSIINVSGDMFFS